MSFIHIQQISTKIKELFEKKLDLKDISYKYGEDQESNVLSRCLAAYAIYHLSGCSLDEAANAVTDGEKDNGIDAIYYSEYLKKLFVVQSKWKKDGSGEPDKGDLLKINQGIKDLFQLNLDTFNEKIKNKYDSINNALNTYGAKFEIVLIDTCTKSDLVSDNIRPIQQTLDEINENGDSNAESVATFKRMNQSEIHRSLIMKAGRDSINLELGLSNWGSVSEPYKAFYGCIPANEISSWWEEYGDKLFENNIRKVLGRTDVNGEMEKTLQDCPNLFWYFNNGITIIADKISKTSVGGGAKTIGSFKLENVSIVNGAQTVSTIGKFKSTHSEDSLNNVQVNIRLIEVTKNSELEKSITKANNRQNRIEGMDFASQDIEQQRIKNELILENIEYSIMRSESFKSSDKSFNLQEATIALASVNKNINLAVQVKNAIGKFFEDLDKGIYKEIFNAGVNGYQVYNSVLFTRKIDSLLNEKIESLSKRGGRLYGIYTHGNRVITHLVAKKINIYSQLTNKSLNIDIYNDLNFIIEKISKFIEDKYPDAFLASFFKNMTKCKELEAYIFP
ncbi:AIPR family protein [Aggregatibacter kilianii]|uniref:AIPR family protein n=1 Tax=Aggregatibacter kilianii TaxID=2025884 RepID=UPI000D65CAFE|nr:AIPR family protein [Aggregatibacter kilianii]